MAPSWTPNNKQLVNTQDIMHKEKYRYTWRAEIGGAGTYYVGDPCYCMGGQKWMEFLRAWYRDPEAFIDGDGNSAPKDNPLNASVVETPEGKAFIMSTGFGDGCLADSDGNTYGIDSGTIGVVQVGLVNRDDTLECTRKVYLGGPVSVVYEDGVLSLKDGDKYVLVLDLHAEDDEPVIDLDEVDGDA